MKKSIITAMVSVMMILAASANGQIALGTASQKGNIKVVVDGFQNDKGIAKIGLCNSTESFKNAEETAVISTTTRIVQGKAEYVFEGVPFGTYAVSVYHDENANGKLDKGLFGKPLEVYGFSNNARELFNRPAYEKAAFVLERAEMTLRVTVQ